MWCSTRHASVHVTTKSWTDLQQNPVPRLSVILKDSHGHLARLNSHIWFPVTNKLIKTNPKENTPTLTLTVDREFGALSQSWQNLVKVWTNATVKLKHNKKKCLKSMLREREREKYIYIFIFTRFYILPIGIDAFILNASLVSIVFHKNLLWMLNISPPIPWTTEAKNTEHPSVQIASKR